MFGKSKEILIYSPVDGVVKNLKMVEDPVFNSGMIGDGVAITPASKTVYSVVDRGEIKVSFKTNHAFGISTKFGPEILLHIGIDTVMLEGKGFKTNVRQGQKITQKTNLVELDLDFLQKNAKSTDIMILVTNESFGDYKITNVLADKTQVKVGDILFKLFIK